MNDTIAALWHAPDFLDTVHEVANFFVSIGGAVLAFWLMQYSTAGCDFKTTCGLLRYAQRMGYLIMIAGLFISAFRPEADILVKCGVIVVLALAAALRVRGNIVLKPDNHPVRTFTENLKHWV